jgi:hypothetical protein
MYLPGRRRGLLVSVNVHIWKLFNARDSLPFLVRLVHPLFTKSTTSKHLPESVKMPLVDKGIPPAVPPFRPFAL